MCCRMHRNDKWIECHKNNSREHNKQRFTLLGYNVGSNGFYMQYTVFHITFLKYTTPHFRLPLQQHWWSSKPQSVLRATLYSRASCTGVATVCLGALPSCCPVSYQFLPQIHLLHVRLHVRCLHAETNNVIHVLYAYNWKLVSW